MRSRTSWIPCYTYNAFGNMQSITGSPGRATPTNSATNLTGASIHAMTMPIGQDGVHFDLLKRLER